MIIYTTGRKITPYGNKFSSEISSMKKCNHKREKKEKTSNRNNLTHISTVIKRLAAEIKMAQFATLGNLMEKSQTLEKFSLEESAVKI